MKFCIIILSFILFLSYSHVLFAQGDDSDEVRMTQKEWHLKRDQYAVSAITLLERLETLTAEIDSLKQLNDSSDKTISGCEDALYALVGATREQVSDFRIKFSQTENSINSKTFTPSDIKKSSYDEITDSKIRCLPEFASRYDAMKNKIDNFTEATVKEIPENSYVVNEGDNLWSIAISKYGNPYMWRLIWEANKLQLNSGESVDDKFPDEIMNPNLIFPGQVLIIPAINNPKK